MSIDKRIEDATVQLEADVHLTHEIVHGDEDTEVQTEGGPVPTHAKVARDSNEEIIGLLQPTVEDINEHAEYVSDKATESGNNATRAEDAADRAEEISGIEDVQEALRLAAVPAPDFHLPLISDLRIEEGFGEPDQIDVSEAQDGSVMVNLLTRSAVISRSSSSTLIDRSGNVMQVDENVPRFERDGLLIEGGGTNFLTFSENIDSANKYISNISYEPSTEGGIGGGILSNVDPDRSSYYRMSIGGSSTEGDIISSVFIKPYIGTNVFLGVVARNGESYIIGTRDINLETGDDNFVSEKLSNGMYRVSVIYDCGTGISSNSSGIEVSLNLDLTDNVWIGGWQVQTFNESSRSYIQTLDTPVTKNRDTLSIDVESNFPSIDTPFTIYGKVSIKRDLNSYLPIMGTPEGDGIAIYAQFGQLRAQPNSETGSAYIIEMPRSFAFACVFSGTHTTVYADGRVSNPVPYVGNLTIYEEVLIGGNGGIGQRLCGHLKELKLFHEELTPEQLSSMGL